MSTPCAALTRVRCAGALFYCCAQPVLALLKHLSEVGVVTTTQLSKGVSRMVRAVFSSLCIAEQERCPLSPFMPDDESPSRLVSAGGHDQGPRD